MSFRRFLLKRTAIAAVLTLVAVSIIFATLRFLPGDPFSGLIASGALTTEQLERVRAMYGLDEPLHVQYLKYVRNLFTLQFGISLTQQRPGRRDTRSGAAEHAGVTPAGTCRDRPS
jgi:ABC-type dipeptide/oligopeptide/nickel transport systems, permease components